MAPAQPKTITNDLYGMLYEQAKSVKPNELVLQRVLRDAHKLQAVDAPAASLVKAAVAALRWDLVEMERWLKNAFAFGRTAETLVNAAEALLLVNRYEEAMVLYLEAFGNFPLSQPVAVRSYLNLMQGGRFQEAAAVRDHMRAQNMEFFDEAPDAGRYMADMARIGISQARVQSELSVAWSVLVDTTHRVREVVFALDEDPDGWVSLIGTFVFFGDVDDEMQLESAIAERLADMPEWNPCELSIELRGVA